MTEICETAALQPYEDWRRYQRRFMNDWKASTRVLAMQASETKPDDDTLVALLESIEHMIAGGLERSNFEAGEFAEGGQ